jgi:SARP family transcriptional regulator, regulator of embCAB operon
MWQNLSEELGIEPSPALQRLERAILSHDPHLDGAVPTAFLQLL